ncbi:dihydrofolate reductase family protein [Nocardia sp. NPDC004415]
MGKIVVAEFVSADGIIENPAWTAPYWNDAIGEFKNPEVFDADALLLGRVTYEGFAAAWPAHPEEGEYKDRMNSMPKFVATSTGSELDWNATRIEGDLAESIAKLRAEHDLLVYGSAALVELLRAHDLVDEYRLVVYPVFVGKGLRLFTDVDATAELELTSSETLDNGVQLNVLTVTGRTPA